MIYENMEDLSKYWFLQNRKEKGAPVGISECSIRTEFNERNPHALRPSDYDEWTSSGWKKVELPEELWLISPDRKYLFDIRWFHYGFVVSERFLELLLSDSTQPFVHREVFIRNRKRIITEGRYYYLRFYSDTSNLIDKDRSQLSYNKKTWLYQCNQASLYCGGCSLECIYDKRCRTFGQVIYF
jgi:hypothetical protein